MNSSNLENSMNNTNDPFDWDNFDMDDFFKKADRAGRFYGKKISTPLSINQANK